MAKTRRISAQSRRGSPGCLSMLFLLICVIAAAVAARFIFFKMRTVEVVGAEHYAPEQIVSASGAEIGSNLVFVSKSGMTRGIFAELPYVSEVRINRKLPDTLVITVSETYAAAYVAEGGVYWLIDPSGKILERCLERPSGVMEITGATPLMPTVGSKVDFGEESELRLGTFVTAVEALERTGFISEVQSIDLSGVYDLSVRCCNRFNVELGAPEELDYKLEYLDAIINDKLRPNQKGSIDLSKLIEKGEARFLEEY